MGFPSLYWSVFLNASRPITMPPRSAIFSPCCLSIHVQPVNAVAVKLVHQHLCPLCKLNRILRQPPFFQVSIGVKLAAHIVEAVCHLVADGGSSRIAVNDRVVYILILCAGDQEL